MSTGIGEGFSEIPLKKFVVILDQPPDFVVTSVSDLFRLNAEEAPADDGERGEAGDDELVPPPNVAWNFKKHVSSYAQPSSEQDERFCSQADGFRSASGNSYHFLLRVSCCCFCPAYFCPAKHKDMVHLNWFEQV